MLATWVKTLYREKTVYIFRAWATCARPKACSQATKFRCFYCSNVGEISQARWLTKRNSVLAKRNIVWTRRKFAFTKRNFVFQEFVADYRITVIITSCKSTGTCKRDHYCKKKHRNDCYNCGEVLRQNGAFWLVTFFYFFLNIILF